MKVATCNVRDTLDLAKAEQALRAVLAAAPDVLLIQEWGGHERDDLLGRVCKDLGYAWARPKVGGGPVAWKVARYGHQPVRVRAKQLAPAQDVGHLAGRRDELPASYLTLVRLHDDIGREDEVGNFHLTAEVQFGSSYRKDAAHKRRVRRHRRERRTLGRVALARRLVGRQLYLGGDTNFSGFTIPGLTSCWKNRKGGTLGSRAVDVVCTTQAATGVRTIPTPSDHKAVVANY